MLGRFLLLALLMGSDWPEWRGPHRDGIVSEEPAAWPAKLNLKWKTEVGIGHASPVMAAGSIYEFTRLGDQETVVSIDPASGTTESYICPWIAYRF